MRFYPWYVVSKYNFNIKKFDLQICDLPPFKKKVIAAVCSIKRNHSTVTHLTLLYALLLTLQKKQLLTWRAS